MEEYNFDQIFEKMCKATKKKSFEIVKKEPDEQKSNVAELSGFLIFMKYLIAGAAFIGALYFMDQAEQKETYTWSKSAILHSGSKYELEYRIEDGRLDYQRAYVDGVLYYTNDYKNNSN